MKRIHVPVQNQLVMAVILIMFITLFAFSPAAGQTASVPQLINYQGRLTDASGAGITGLKKLEINIHDAATAGNLVWGPQVLDNVPMVDGHFNVILGPTDTASPSRSINTAFSSANAYLGVKVTDSGGDITGIAEIIPRQQILSAPFSFLAENATNAENLQGQGPDWYLPIGIITPFYHPDLVGHPELIDSYLPRNWVVCDGQTLNETHPRVYSQSEVDPSLWGKALPNLVGRFTRGIENVQTLGFLGGQDSINTEHIHEITGISTGFILNDPSSCDTSASYYAREQGSCGQNHIGVWVGGAEEGQHRHSIQGAMSPAGSTAVATVPKYMAVYYIMRIK